MQRAPQEEKAVQRGPLFSLFTIFLESFGERGKTCMFMKVSRWSRLLPRLSFSVRGPWRINQTQWQRLMAKHSHYPEENLFSSLWLGFGPQAALLRKKKRSRQNCNFMSADKEMTNTPELWFALRIIRHDWRQAAAHGMPEECTRTNQRNLSHPRLQLS